MRFTILAVLGLVGISLFGVSYAQMDCIGCVQIPHSQIKMYTELFPLTIWTDSQKYDHSSTVYLYGNLRPKDTSHPVNLTIVNGIGNIVAVEQLYPADDGSFYAEFNTSSTLWSQDGFYVINVQSRGDTRIFKTQIELVPYDVGIVSLCTDSELSIATDNGGIYCIAYSTLGQTPAVDASLSLATKTLSLNVRSASADTITLMLPRYLIDAKSTDGTDTDFVVFLDGEEYDFLESSADSENFRTVSISYSPDRQGIIDIVGTTVVPEFGSIALLVTVLGILSVLIFSSKRFYY